MSEFLKKQIDAKQKAWNEAQALIDSVEARGNVWTGEDEQKFANLNAEIDRRNSIIKTEEEMQARAAVAAQAAEGVSVASTPNNSDEAILRSMALGETRSHEFRTITSGSTGAPVPTSFYPKVVELARLVNPLLDLATVLNTSSGEPLQIPSLSAFSTATIKAAGSAIAASDPTFNSFVTLNSYKFSHLIQVSRELVLDSGVNLVDFLTSQAGNAFGYGLGDKFINGTGTVEPTGILATASSAVTGGTGVAGAPTADNIFDLIYSVDGALRQKSSFGILANAGTIAVMRKLKDNYGRYLFDPQMSQQGRDLIGGVTVYEQPNMPAVGLGAKSIVAGDLSAYFVRNVGGLQVDRSDDYAFGNDLVTWRFTWRADGALVQPTHIKYFKGGAS